MKNMRALLLSVIALVFLVGCENLSTSEKRVLGGTALGAGAGALIGSISGHAGTGAAIGAGAGLVGGYLYDQDQKANGR